MKFRTLVIGYSLALALFLFAQHRPGISQPGAFRRVVDLTRSIELVSATPAQFVPASSSTSLHGVTRTEASRMGTRIIAPAQVASSLWNVEAIPAGRLVAPLAIIDVTAETRDRSDYQVSVADIARWEQANGEIPLGSVVMVRTGWKSSEKNSLEFSQDAALFLVDGRKVVGLGTDAPVAHENDELSEADRYALSHSAYELDNVANLYGVPDHGAVVLVAPTKVEGRASAPVRVMALVR